MFKIGDELYLVDTINDTVRKDVPIVVMAINLKTKEIKVRRRESMHIIDEWFPSDQFVLIKKRNLPEWF